MELKVIPLEIPEGGNIIVGQSHFIKTVEDIYEAIVNTVPQMKFGIAFNEASGACLTRVDGNDDALKALAAKNASAVAAGHTFVVVMTDFELTIRGCSFYDDEYVKQDGAWRIRRTGYKRIYEEIQPRGNVEGLQLTASWWATGGRSKLPAG